jgi:polyisoprenyl-phosphate glycosyltransferase
LTAGLDHADGDAVILMDADLQHPPAVIEHLVAAWRAGADMVIAARVNRDTDGLLRRVLTHAFYWLFNAMSKVEVTIQTGDFRLLDRRAIVAMQALPERNRFMKGLYALVGLNVASVPYVHEGRRAGQSQFGFKRLWRFAIDGLASFTSAPLRVWSYVGIAIAVPAGLYAAYFVARTLIYGVDLPGYPSLATMILFFSGIQLISLGVLGEYVGRVYDEAKQRPLYVVSETVGNFEPLPKFAHGGIRLPDRKIHDAASRESA